MTALQSQPASPLSSTPTGEVDDSPRAAQRAALRDLVSLATESAATEARIEREQEKALADAHEQFEKGQQTLVHKYNTLAAQVREKFEQKRVDVEAKARQARAELRAADEPARRKILGEFAQVQQLVDQKVSQATWEAESVMEMTQATLAEQEKKLRDEVALQIQGVDALDHDLRQLAAKYGYIPTGETADAPAADADPGTPEAALAAFEQKRDAAQSLVKQFQSLRLPQLFVGVFPFIVAVTIVGLAGAAAWVLTGGIDGHPNWIAVAGAGGGALVVSLILGLLMSRAANRQVREGYTAAATTLVAARRAAEDRIKAAVKVREDQIARARHKRDSEAKFARDKYLPAVGNAEKKRDAAMVALEAKSKELAAKIEADRTQGLAEADEWAKRHTADVQTRREREQTLTRGHYEQRLADANERYRQAREALEIRLREGLATTSGGAGGPAMGTADVPLNWNDPRWAAWTPPKQFVSAVRFGELRVDLKKIAERAPAPVEPSAAEEAAISDDPDHQTASSEPVPTIGHVRLELPPAFAVPATLGFPRQASLLIQSDRDGRLAAVRALQMLMTRLLTSLPAGRARFTLIDPVGLGQNFAGFMHLADHDEALVGGRIWTEQDQIEQRLTNLTGHMETVIQKYLRNEFETIDDYNAQAGELAEPYRFLVVSDFPAGFTDESFRRLASIASTGARCGVYTLVFRDTRLPLPSSVGTVVDDLIAHGVNLVQQGDGFVWDDPVFQQFPLTIDPPASEEALTTILDKVGKAAKEANRVEVPFSTIAPKPEQFWTRSSASEIGVPVGRTGATRLQEMKLGKGVAQHVLMAGKTGSGKSTLLHAMVTNLAMWYSPDEVEFYLIDFKKGVEFKTYATHLLPHARAIAVESDREFGISVLQRLDAELARRGDIYRRAGVQDLAGYRASAGSKPMPRTLLIVDEFQEFFSEDDKLAQEASVLLDRLVRQGRAFGIHVLLGSQTIGGASGLPRSTIGQMAVRVALQTSDADSQLILGDNNSAARLLSRPGEAIYNDQGGLVEGNSPFQVAWLPDEQRERYLAAVRSKADSPAHNGFKHHEPPVVFEGNAPADFRKNVRLAEALALKAWPEAQNAYRAFVGEPVAIKEPSAVVFRRQSGANVIIIGQNEEPALAIMVMSMISLAAQHKPGTAKFYVLDATPADSPLVGTFEKVKAVLPQETKIVDFRAVPDAVNELATELAARRESQTPAAESVYVFVYGLQRYRSLRKGEDDFSFSMNPDEEKKADPGKQFAELLKEGPAFGIHIITWADTPISVERTLDRGLMREFDHRILFQMSSNDSSNLIDSPAANKLGFHRALYYSEEQGLLEKFRPYALPGVEWLTEAGEKLRQRG